MNQDIDACRMEVSGWSPQGKPFGLVIEMTHGCQKKGCSAFPFAPPHDPDLAHDIEPTKRKNPLAKAA